MFVPFAGEERRGEEWSGERSGRGEGGEGADLFSVLN